MSVSVRACVPACVCLCMRACVLACMRARLCVYVFYIVCTCARARACVCVCVCARVCAFVSACIFFNLKGVFALSLLCASLFLLQPYDN